MEIPRQSAETICKKVDLFGRRLPKNNRAVRCADCQSVKALAPDLKLKIAKEKIAKDQS